MSTAPDPMAPADAVAAQDTPAERADLRSTAKRLLPYVRPQGKGLVLTVMAYVVAAATEPLVPQMIKTLADSGFQSAGALPLWWVPVALIGLFAVRGLFGFLGQFGLHWCITKSVMAMRQHLMDTLLRLDAQVYTRLQAGAAVTKVVNDPQQLMGLLGNSLIVVLRDGLPALAILAYLLWMNWQLTLLSLATTPLMAWVVKKVNRRVQAMGNWAYDAQIRLVNKVDDATRAWRVVRSFDAADHEREQFALRAREVQRSNLKTAAANALTQPLSQLIASVGLSGIVSLALLQAQRDAASVGDFIAFITALLLLMSRVRHLSDVAQPITNALIVARGCLELLDEPAERDPGHKVLAQARGQIELTGVSLSYPGASKPALQGLDLLIEAGKTTALVGASGAGKSSVVSLLLGFAKAQGGQVLIDGQDMQDLTLASLRRQFAVVSQDIVLFDSSVADNVAYGQARDEVRLEQALRSAHLWEVVQALPQGLETSVGANGSKLSGGQRQRLAIARALYKDAPIWIFDEATSALDTESERAVQQALEQWQGRKTLLVIAHRLSTIRHADCIQVMGEGRVLEHGTHEALMAADGVYTRLVRAQFGA